MYYAALAVVMAESMIAQAGKDVSSQKYDAAMEKALMALEQSEGQPRIKVQALQTIVGIDIMTSRDADAWGKALEAETIARKHGLDKELAGILISKAKLCSYAEISPETGRNDEGLEYANEALRIAETIKEPELEAEACFIIGSLYINKNRWSDPIDQGIYRTAGQWLDRGQAVADANGIERLRRNGVLFRSRWFQQGGRNEEALEYFANARKNIPEDDHLMASALDDRLVRLYTRTGNAQSALDAHDDYVREITRYMNQKSDETLQEMETRFEVQEKERKLERRGYQITILLMLVMLAAAIIVIAVNHIRRVRRRNDELLRINATKEQLIKILSKDLRNPAQAYRSDLEKLSEEAATLDSEQIRERCRKIAESAQSINQDVANYVGDILIERGRKIADIGLSQREIQIIRLSAEGLTAAEMAEKLFLSVHTVNTHRQRIYAKMDVKNVSDMLHTASELGII
jgi:DNA-binding CsgD family transcriptional regulator